MAKQNHVIYLPGIGDGRSWGQRQALLIWRLYGVRAHYHKIGWGDGEAFAPKLDRITAQIDELVAAGHRVSLVGVSAGASAAISAYGARSDKISRVVCVCGKIGNTGSIGSDYYGPNPAFAGSIQQMNQVLPNLSMADRAKMLSIHPLADHTVPIEDTYLEGAAVGIFPTRGHMVSIGYGVTFGAGMITRFITSA